MTILSLFRTIAVCVFVTACNEPIIISPDAVLPDGSEYAGELKNGKFEGTGKLVFADGGFHQGQFADGLYHGHGVHVTGNGFRYEGTFRHGRMSGRFTMHDPMTDLHYDGEMKNWTMHGEGSLSAPTYQYTGSFDAGFFHGHGKLKNADGSVYEGQFKRGSYHGQGKLSHANGHYYEGTFKDNLYHGHGKEVNGEAQSYEGAFSNGRYHGEGIFTQGKSRFTGDFVAGVFSGRGSYTDYSGAQYQGDIANWTANGEGTWTSADGDVKTGSFKDGYLEGAGKLVGADGSVYEGHFEFGEPSGQGVKTNADKSVYTGEFSYGRYHGYGELRGVNDSGAETVLKGRWRNNTLVHNEVTGARLHDQAELALEHHQTLLETVLDNVTDGHNAATDVYFLGVAGDGSQSVFRREIEYVSDLLTHRYANSGRAIRLINHHDTANMYPMATRRSIASALGTIARKMDVDDDILFMYLTSHGSSSHEFYLNHNSIDLPPLSANELASLLQKTPIKWKVVMVSDCYSGGFISELADEHTLIMTAADRDSRSFGCSEESEMTYFGRAFFKEVLADNPDESLVKAFASAKVIIDQWESEQELDPSNPQISAPAAIVEKLEELLKN